MKTNMPKDKLCEKLEKKLNKKLEDMDVDFTVSAKEIYKNNENLIGLMIKAQDSNVSPTIYLNDQDLEDLETKELKPKQIAQRLVTLREQSKDVSFDTNKFQDPDFILANVVPQVYGENNKEQLQRQGFITKDYLNMVITYAVKVDILRQEIGDDQPVGSYKITDKLLQAAGLTIDQIHQAAIENVERQIYSENLTQMLKRMMPFAPDMENPDAPPIDVITTNDKLYGAAVILTDKFKEEMQRKQDEYGEPIVILPSSIHEILVLPAGGENTNTLLNMVMEVNATQLAPQERLADAIYVFNNGKISVIDDISLLCEQQEEEDQELE